MSPAPTRTASGISDGEAPGATPDAASEAVGAAPEAVGPAEGLADGATLGAADRDGLAAWAGERGADPAPWLMRLAKPSRRTSVAAKATTPEHHGPTVRCRTRPGLGRHRPSVSDPGARRRSVGSERLVAAGDPLDGDPDRPSARWVREVREDHVRPDVGVREPLERLRSAALRRPGLDRAGRCSRAGPSDPSAPSRTRSPSAGHAACCAAWPGRTSCR